MDVLRRDLTILQGTSWSTAWRFRLAGSAFIDSTWTVRAQVRPSVGWPTVLHEWSTVAGSAVVSDDGTVTLSVLPEISSAWAWTTGHYDVEASKAGVVHRLVAGRVAVSREVTR